jgi:hypothetical protein
VPASYGQLHRGDRSVVGLFVPGWGAHVQGAVEASVVPQVDPAGGGVLDVGWVLKGRWWKMSVPMHSVLYRPMIDSRAALPN